jgi:hypothetical protein
MKTKDQQQQQQQQQRTSISNMLSASLPATAAISCCSPSPVAPLMATVSAS